MSKIIGIIGDRGSGKSVLETIILKEAFDSGINVFSNYWLSFINDENYISFEEMAKLPVYLINAYVGMDEIQMGMDSRNFFSKSNTALTTLVTQIRKRGLTLIYTTQRLRYGDRRLREQTDFLLFPEPIKPFTKDGILIDTLFYCKVQEVKTGKIVNTFYFDAYEVFKNKLYDTDEIIDFSIKRRDIDDNG